MPRCRIKICGITRAEDALLAANCGADAVGLIFHPGSPRDVNPDKIEEIVANLPAFVTVVGLFVDPSVDKVESVLESGLIQCLQFHGNESLKFCQSFALPFIKTVRVKNLAEARRDLEPFNGACSIILDTYVSGVMGGTGQTFDWSVARALVESSHNPIILAGGIDAENAAAAIAAVHPFGIDLCSGVESAPGIKDPDKLIQLFNAVNG